MSNFARCSIFLVFYLSEAIPKNLRSNDIKSNTVKSWGLLRRLALLVKNKFYVYFFEKIILLLAMTQLFFPFLLLTYLQRTSTSLIFLGVNVCTALVKDSIFARK